MLVCHFPRLKKEGQGLVEYALILVLIAIVCIVVLQVLGRGTSNALSTVGSAMTAAPVAGS
jgi:pilus assembly protein Flp/PilA